MSRSSVIHDLRRTVDRLPVRTRQAMLEGVRHERIIVGAYTDQTGGVCPMLAAHRRGGRTSFLQFARTWDRFTKAPAHGSRPATDRELRILERQLQASLDASEEALSDVILGDVIAEHQALVARHQTHEPLAVKPTPRRKRRPAVAARMPGWMRPIRSIEEYERALAEVDRQQIRLGLVGDTAGPQATSAATDEPQPTFAR